jgi:uncharacterized protein (DUF1684 family)
VNAGEVAQLAEWRREISDLYSEARRRGGGREAWDAWREGKQELYRHHPQSPVPAEHRDDHVFRCFDHDPAMRTLAELVATDTAHVDGDDQVPGMARVGVLRFQLDGRSHQLAAFWLDGYAGGLFVPFADATSGGETYGGGRYVLDTAKGADLGVEAGRVVLDFNFAYAPSCAHDPRWRCPLAQAGSRLSVAVRAGEIGPDAGG